MYFNLILLLSLWVPWSFAQDLKDVKFLADESIIGSQLSLPIYINRKGDISVIQNRSESVALSPLVQVGLSWTNINYIAPVKRDHFDFLEQLDGQDWIELKRFRYEYGLGLAAALTKVIGVGLNPYKGGMQTLIQTKSSRKSKIKRIALPKTLKEMGTWATKDVGLFQTYGGIQAYASAGVSVVNILSVSLLIQNQFLISIRKMSPSKVELSISEEHLTIRQLSVGPFAANDTFSRYNGKLFSASFQFDMSVNEHHELFALALKGKVKDVQERLPVENQSMKWVGNEEARYFGLPILGGKTIIDSHYDIDINKQHDDLELHLSKNRGLLTSFRNHYNMVFATDNLITLFWSSEMKQTHLKALEKNFLSRGRALGVSGFIGAIPATSHLGTVLTQIGLGITKTDLTGLSKVQIMKVEQNLKLKCIAENLPCADRDTSFDIMLTFKQGLESPWPEMRRKIGHLMLQNPALVNALMKTLNVKRPVYFKFLSDSYQSLEGVGVIEI
jgi:hypothetical protein